MDLGSIKDRKVGKYQFMIFPKVCFDCNHKFCLTNMWRFKIEGDVEWIEELNDYGWHSCDTILCDKCMAIRAKRTEMTINQYANYFSAELINIYRPQDKVIIGDRG